MEEDLKEKSLGGIIYRHFGPDKEQSKVKTLLEFMIYFVGLLGTVLSLLQAYKIWFFGIMGSNSIIPWIALASFTPFWILYGIVQKKMSMVMTYVVWLVINLLVIIGILVRG